MVLRTSGAQDPRKTAITQNLKTMTKAMTKAKTKPKTSSAEPKALPLLPLGDGSPEIVIKEINASPSSIRSSRIDLADHSPVGVNAVQPQKNIQGYEEWENPDYVTSVTM